LLNPAPGAPGEPQPPSAPLPSSGGDGGLTQGAPGVGVPRPQTALPPEANLTPGIALPEVNLPGRSLPGMEGPGLLPEEKPQEPGVVDAVPGVGTPAGGTISVPVVAGAPATAPRALAPRSGSVGAGSGLREVATGGQAGTDPPLGARPAAPAGGTPPVAVSGFAGRGFDPSSYRAGYREYLRSAPTPQLAVLAVPGAIGILALTAAGGLVGYRQAKASHTMRGRGAVRFMN
jgi:hypothetical protein